jgi:hypothetical protein
MFSNSKSSKERDNFQPSKPKFNRFSSSRPPTSSFTPNLINVSSKGGMLSRSTSDNSVFSDTSRGKVQKKFVHIEEVSLDPTDAEDCILPDQDVPDDESEENNSNKEKEKQTVHNLDLNEIATQMTESDGDRAERGLGDDGVDLIGDENEESDGLHALKHPVQPPPKRSRSVGTQADEPSVSKLRRVAVKQRGQQREHKTVNGGQMELLHRVRKLEEMMKDRIDDEEMDVDDDDQDDDEDDCDDDQDDEGDQDADDDKDDDDDDEGVDIHSTQQLSLVRPLSVKAVKAR